MEDHQHLEKAHEDQVPSKVEQHSQSPKDRKVQSELPKQDEHTHHHIEPESHQHDQKEGHKHEPPSQPGDQTHKEHKKDKKTEGQISQVEPVKPEVRLSHDQATPKASQDQSKQGIVETKILPVVKESTPSQSKPPASHAASPKSSSSQTLTSEEMLAKIKSLETKVSYYESQHTEYQNQLLVQRKHHEDETASLKKQLQQLQEHPKESHREPDSSIEQLKGLQEQIEQLVSEKQHFESENLSLKAQIADFQTKNEVNEAVREGILQTMSVIQQQIVLENQAMELQKEHMQRQPTPSANEEKLASKLQKKIEEFERYLEEKDKALLEQETQLSELQDQIHEHIKAEDTLKTQAKDRQVRVDELLKELKLTREQYEVKIADMQHQLSAKDGSLSDAWAIASEKELEIQRGLAKLKELDQELVGYKESYAQMQEECQTCQQRAQESMEEVEQIRQDFQQVMNFKNELEILIEEQTQHIESKNKKLRVVEETVRFKESELEKKESLLRRMTTGADDMRKKLSQAEMKMRQLTQTTLRDMKTKLKDQLNEIEILKEMVKSANKQAKAKDIDIQRLSKKIQRLEKLSDMNRNIMAQDASSIGLRVDDSQSHLLLNQGASSIIQEENENLESDGFTTPLKVAGGNAGGDLLGLNPINYSSSNIEDEVQMEILNAQQQRHFSLKNPTSIKKGPMPQGYNGAALKNYKQKELEEALELDRMLEQERRNQSQDVFQKKYEAKFDNYLNNITSVPNYKNSSSGVKGIFGTVSQEDSASSGFPGQQQLYAGSLKQQQQQLQYEGLLPNLNVSKREQLEQELMLEMNNEALRKDKYMTPNLQGKQKVVNKLNAAAYQGGLGSKQNISQGSNAPYFHERNSKTSAKKQL